jgi:hypothetical protein
MIAGRLALIENVVVNFINTSNAAHIAIPIVK